MDDNACLKSIRVSTLLFLEKNDLFFGIKWNALFHRKTTKYNIAMNVENSHSPARNIFGIFRSDTNHFLSRGTPPTPYED